MPLDPNDPVLERVIGVSNAELERFTAARQRRLLDVYERERDVLLQRLGRMGTADTFTARHLQVALKVLEDSITRLQVELGEVFESAFKVSGEWAADSAVREVGQLEAAFGSAATARTIASLSGVVPHRAIDEVVQLGKFETEGLVVEIDTTTKQILQRGLLQGRSSRDLVGEMSKAIGAAMDSKGWQLERTLRTGLNAAVARGHNETYLEIRDEVLPGLQRQGHEYLKSKAIAERASNKAGIKRVNHLFSAYLEGAVADLDKPWRIQSPQFPVMFWSRQDGAYVGMHYPAHLFERGRQVPYHPAWEGVRSKGAERTARAKEMQSETEVKLSKWNAKKGGSQHPAAGGSPTTRERPASGAEARRLIIERSARMERFIKAADAQAIKNNRRMRELFSSDASADQEELSKLIKRNTDLTRRRNVMSQNRAEIGRKIISAPTPAAPKVSYQGPGNRVAKWRKGVDEFNRLVGPGLVDGQRVLVKAIPLSKEQRAFYRPSERTLFQDIGDEVKTTVHELSHWLELTAPGARDKAVAFWKQRTQGEPDVKLADLFPGLSFKPDEMTKVDQFLHPYMGKVYYNSNGQIVGTEILSMGIEEMWIDPAGFAKRDPDHFDFVYELLREGG